MNARDLAALELCAGRVFFLNALLSIHLPQHHFLTAHEPEALLPIRTEGLPQHQTQPGATWRMTTCHFQDGSPTPTNPEGTPKVFRLL